LGAPYAVKGLWGHKYALCWLCNGHQRAINPRRSHTVDHTLLDMSLFSPLSPNLLQGPKSSLLKFRVKVQDYEIFPTSVFLGLVVILAVLYCLTSPSRKLPPGPRGYPIIGNLLELRSGKWIKFAEWRKKYGQFLLSLSPCIGGIVC
jgi:hypothetical protein